MRPRQIDITKPLPVVWLKTDEVDHQAQALEGLYKSLTVSKRSTEQVKQKNAELVKSQTRMHLKDRIGEVPIPACRIVDQGPEPDPPFDRGQSYIHYLEAPYDFDMPEYELDDDDFEFIESWNESCVQQGRHDDQMSETELEVMINTFDNQAYIHRNKTGIKRLEDKLKAEALPGVSSGGEDGNGLVVLTDEAMEKLQEFARAEGVDEVLLEYLSMPVEEEAVCAVCRQAHRVKKRDPVTGEDIDASPPPGGRGEEKGVGDASPTPARTRQQQGRHMVLDGMEEYDPNGPLPYRNPDKLLYCSGCGKYAHVRCYLPSWLPLMDDDEWLCDYCDDVSSDLTASKSSKCELCPFDGGLLKRVQGSNKKRAHAICALFLPETSLLPTGVVGIGDVHPGRWDMVCRICHERGACVQCKARYCRAAYHPMCAHDEGLFMNCKTGTVFCPKHSAEKRAREKAGAGAGGGMASKRKMVDMQLLVISTTVKEHSLPKLSAMALAAVEEAFGYWFRKRQKKGSAVVPRLALMQQEAQERDATKPRRGKKVRLEDQEWVDRLVQLRQDLERGRTLLDMLRKRETTKREWTQTSKEIFELYIEHEEQFWGQKSPKKRGRGRPRKDSPPRVKVSSNPNFTAGMHHLWQYVPRPLPRSQLESLFPPNPSPPRKRVGRPRKHPLPQAASYYGNGRARVLERDADGRFKMNGAAKRSHKRKEPARRTKTGRPVGRPRKHPLPPPPEEEEEEREATGAMEESETERKNETREREGAGVVEAEEDPEDVVVDVTNLESGDENSDVDIEGSDSDDHPMADADDCAEEESGDEGAAGGRLGKRKSARLSGVSLPDLKKRRR